MTREQASQLINDLLKLMLSHRGSDLFISADFPPAIKIDGVMTKASSQALQAEHTNMMARAIMTDRQLTEFERSKECNFAIGTPGPEPSPAWCRQPRRRGTPCRLASG